MELRNLVHFFYKGGRSLVRATGLTGPARKLLGPAAGRFVYSRSANADGSLMIQGRKMFLAPKGSYPSPDMIVDRYEKGTTDLFRELLKPGMVVVDVGANVGYFSLLAAELVGSSGKVYAFEPEPGNHGVLQKNIEINSLSNIQVEEMAVSDNSGVADFFLSELDSGSHSLFGDAARGIRESVQVTTTTLDAFLEAEGWPNIDLVKIDVEGAEDLVFDGARNLLATEKPALLFECSSNFEYIKRHLYRAGYIIVNAQTFEETTVNTHNMFAFHREKHDWRGG